MKYVILSKSINSFDLPKIETILNKNKIDFFLKSSYESSVISGWMEPGASFNDKILFVDSSKLDEAKIKLNKYL